MNRRWLLFGGMILALTALVILVALNHKKAKKPVAPPVAKASVISSSILITQAKDFEVKGNLLETKATYQKLIDGFSSSNEVSSWQKKVEDINIKLLFSQAITPNSMFYEIKPGDTLTKIAREFKTTPELIMKSNNLADDKILPGRKIKVWIAPFNILVDKSQNILILKSNDEFFKTYVVSTGLNNCTPLGTFKIINKLQNPTWYKAGAVVPAGSQDNILGTRWLGFDLLGYGIHGTTEPQSLGKQVTQGCVRMSNNEVEELYTIVPVGIEVNIVD